ncbi:MAG: shikimate kinase [Hydrogenoanaerobacterium sp.]
MQRKNIFLCGFMGCGKTTVGKELALRTFYTFNDTDECAEKLAGKSIKEIFSEDGEAAFRDLEARVLSELVCGSGQVIATGGGFVLRPSNVRLAKQNGKIIFINTPFELCYKRAAFTDRPLLQGKTCDEAEVLYKERFLLYRAAADYEIFNSDTPQDTVNDILTALSTFL